MYKSKYAAIVLASILLTVPFGCKDTSSTAEHDGGGEGEEPGTRFAIDETYDVVRKGVRLILAYDNESAAFTGTVTNVTDQTIEDVRVEVHLSNGTELGPTPRNDLKPGVKLAVELSAEGQTFEWWKAHPEAGEGEHGHEHSGEHAGEHNGEHN